MANIHEVIGTLLQNISEARSSADNISKALSQAYRNDPILRLFPVPRTEIRDVEIELKFGVRGVNERTDVQANKNARRATLIQSTSARFVKELADVASTSDDEGLKQLSDKLDSVRFRDELQAQISGKLSSVVESKDLNSTDREILFDAFNVDKTLVGAVDKKTMFDFQIAKTEEGKFEFNVKDSNTGLEFEGDKAFETEKEAIDGALALIDKGTVKANFKIERVGTSPEDVQVVVVDRNRVLARSDVFSVSSTEASDDALERVRADFVDSSGLIADLRSLKRTRNFREITSRGTVDATELVNVKPVITDSVEKVLPGFIKELSDINKGVFDYEIDAAVDADSMADLPESAISTIKVNAGITNLNWAEVIDEDGESTTKLVEQ